MIYLSFGSLGDQPSIYSIITTILYCYGVLFKKKKTSARLETVFIALLADVSLVQPCWLCLGAAARVAVERALW